jgi:hypothetical protein
MFKFSVFAKIRPEEGQRNTEAMDTEKDFDPEEGDDAIIELTEVVKTRPEVNEFDGLDQDMEDLGTLVSEITGHRLLPDMGINESDLPGWQGSPATLEAAVEKAVEKLFKEKIEARIMALFEEAVKREIEKITEMIRNQTRTSG